MSGRQTAADLPMPSTGHGTRVDGPSPSGWPLFTSPSSASATFDSMDSTLLNVTCSDLHPGCSGHLWGRSAEELVLAYVLHHQDEHVVPQVELDDLLGAVTAQVPRPQPAPAVPASRTLSLTA